MLSICSVEWPTLTSHHRSIAIMSVTYSSLSESFPHLLPPIMGSIDPALNPFKTFDSTTLIHFFLNGSPITLNTSTIDPDSTLLDFIRSQGPGFTGTKLGCGEGGCGACTVVIQSKHPLTKRIQHIAVNACLAPIISVDGKHVITVEGLGNSENPHPLQERMWKMSGSQCGFCTVCRVVFCSSVSSLDDGY